MSPLIINIVGLPKIGVTTLCGRIKRSFDLQGLPTTVIAPRSAKDVLAFEDKLLIGDYSNARVLLIDNHFYTTCAIKKNLRKSQFADDSVRPDFSVLLTAKSIDDYQVITRDTRTDYRGKQSVGHLMDSYRHCDTRHFGTDNHFVVPVNAIDDRLYAAGYVARLIKKEMTHVKSKTGA